MREPRSDMMVHEVFVDELDAAATRNVAESVANSYSLLMLHHIVDSSECAALCTAASAAAASERQARKNGPAFDAEGMRYDGKTGRIRGPVADMLDSQAQSRCDRIMCSIASQLQNEIPDLIPLLFGRPCLPHPLAKSTELKFSPGEPAINVYEPGGSFRAHTDKQSLTILVPLSKAGGEPGMEPSGDYEGGGTAFWSRKDSVPHALDDERAEQLGIRESESNPKVVLRPSPGTAIVFGGEMTHAALPVLKGLRCVLVASFSSRVIVMGDAALRTRWSASVDSHALFNRAAARRSRTKEDGKRLA